VRFQGLVAAIMENTAFWDHVVAVHVHGVRPCRRNVVYNGLIVQSPT
jgi:hypothetical protein